MKPHYRSISFALLLLLILLLGAGCAHNPETAGTATDAENTLAGIVVDSTGLPVAGVSVRYVTDPIAWTAQDRLSKVSAIPLDSVGAIVTTQTDALGRFRFSNLDTTIKFSLDFSYISRLGGQRGLLLNGLTIHDESSLQEVRLEQTSFILGTLSYTPDTDPLYLFSAHFRVGLEGSGVTTPVIAGNSFSIPGASAGNHVLVFYPSDQLLVQNLIDAGVPMDSVIRRVPIQIVKGQNTGVGNLVWSLPKNFRWLQKDSLVISKKLMKGRALSESGLPLAGIEVRLITDTLGRYYSVNSSSGFPVSDSTVTFTDSLGNWSLPTSTAAYFNLEFLHRNAKDSLIGYGLLTHLSSGMFADSVTTLAQVKLTRSAVIRGIVIYKNEPDSWIDLGTHFRVGIKGTSRFMDVSVGDTFELEGIPSDSQTLLWYPGDSFLWGTIATQLGGIEKMVAGLEFINSAPGTTLQMQIVTYTLPALPIAP